MSYSATANISRTWPTFLLIGAAKSGTTALYYYLNQHPSIFMSSVKEPRFFAMHNEIFRDTGIDPNTPTLSKSRDVFLQMQKTSISDIDLYTSLFDQVQSQCAIGEASPFYLFHPHAPERIKQFVPEVQLIAILRNPIERAFSMYLHQVRKGRETRRFEETLDQEPFNSENIWHANGPYYIRPGFYGRQCARYFNHFSKERIRIYLYDDFVDDSMSVVKDIFSFLNVDESIVPDTSVRHAATGISSKSYTRRILQSLEPAARKLRSFDSASKLAKQLLPNQWRKHYRQSINDSRVTKTLQKSKWSSYANGELLKPEMSFAARKRLNDIYRDDIYILQDILQRDLKHWLD